MNNYQDLQGKKILTVNEKYYVADHGVREAVYGGNMKDINLVLENVVYMELLRRGYSVTVGKVSDKEIDFPCFVLKVMAEQCCCTPSLSGFFPEPCPISESSATWQGSGIYLLCQAPLFFHSRHWKNFCISSGERRTFQFHSSASRKSRILRCLIPSRLISSSSIVTTYFGKLSRTPVNAPNSRWMVSSEASR